MLRKAVIVRSNDIIIWREQVIKALNIADVDEHFPQKIFSACRGMST